MGVQPCCIVVTLYTPHISTTDTEITMAIELEAKIKLVNEAEEAEIIQKISTSLKYDIVAGPLFLREQNIFFDTSTKRLQKREESLRVRLLYKSGEKKPMVVFTHKGPVLKGRYKQREESEFETDTTTAAGIIKMMRQLGYERTFIFEKLRRKWKLKDGYIELDRVPLIGSFVEVEGTNDAYVGSVVAALSLSKRKNTKSSYVKLLKKQVDKVTVPDPYWIQFSDEDRERFYGLEIPDVPVAEVSTPDYFPW